jgi:putative ABC transport system permease protein
LILMVLRKMLSNKWMVICLLAGSILAVAMVSSIPMYTDGVLQRMLTKDLEEYQISSGYFPGRYLVQASIYSHYDASNRIKAYHMVDKKVTQEMVNDIGLPIITQSENLIIDYLSALPEIEREEKPKKRFVKMEALSGLQDHIKIVHGRMFSQERKDDIFEAVVTEEAMKKLDLRLDEVYEVSDFTNQTMEQFRVKVVGVFTVKEKADPYWFQGLWAYNDSLILDHSLFHKEFIETEFPLLTKVQWYYAFDYHKITLNNIGSILKAHESQNRWFSQKRVDFKMPAVPILEQYYQREKQLKTTLWVTQVPILLMLAFYIFMVSQLIVEHERNEIAVLRSRGANGGQIFLGYLLECLFLSLVSMLVGPPLGLLLCTFLGAANGFLEFVQRTALPISLNMKAYIYSLWAVVISTITMLIPVYLSSRTTIVQHKQKKARAAGSMLWKKYFLDIVLLGVAGYGLYSYQMRQKALVVTGVSGTELAIDPLLFIISTLFILGAGLVFLRIFPYIVRLVFWLGRKIWSPSMYASFIQVGRSGGQDRFLMLFIILTLSIGIFNANAARTLNSNIEEKIQYDIGADIVVEALWQSNKPAVSPMDPMGGMGMAQESPMFGKEPVQYIEPPFLPYTQLAGVEKATKVFREKSVVAQTATREHVNRVYLMGIIPDEFGKVAWFRTDLLRPHWYNYLNLMSHHPMAALVSSSFKEKHKVELGDSLWISWGDQGYLEVIVYEFVDYWPTFNPNASETERNASSDLIVANLSYIQAHMALEPYEVWIKKAPEGTSEGIYEDIENKKLQIEELQDSGQQIIKKKNDPMLQGTNGALTLGFIVTMAISTIGFLIYWILSIRQRVLQFGIFRAMGLSVKKIIGMLVCEQVLISGTAIIIGIIIGGITSDLFVPLLQMVYSAVQQVPPFKVAAAREDFIRIYFVVLAMLSIGLSVLGVIISKIKIHQAIKLGED